MLDMFWYPIPQWTVTPSKLSVPTEPELKKQIQHFMCEVWMIYEGTWNQQHIDWSQTDWNTCMAPSWMRAQ